MRVAVVGHTYDLSVRRFDGFIQRQSSLTRALVDHHTVLFIGLGNGGPPEVLRPEVIRGTISYVSIGSSAGNRRTRLGRTMEMARGRAVHVAGAESLVQTVAAARPDMVITIGPWMDLEYSALYGQFPSIYLMEEDVFRMPEIATQSLQGKALRGLERRARTRTPLPDAVVVIAEGEIASAKRRFPASTVRYIPFALDPSEWPISESPSRGDHVLVAGALSQERNSDGLIALFRHLDSRPSNGGLRFRLVSDAGVHSELVPFLGRAWVDHHPPGATLYDEYRSASVAFVPAQRVTGVKTTVLQAWSAGTPVVCYESSARSVGAYASATCHSDDVEDLAASLQRLASNPEDRAVLSAAGRSALRDGYQYETMIRDFLTLVAEVGGTSALL